jgi:hypothetical protein
MRLTEEIKYRSLLAGGPGSGPRPAEYPKWDKDRRSQWDSRATMNKAHDLLTKHGFVGPQQLFEWDSNRTYKHPAGQTITVNHQIGPYKMVGKLIDPSKPRKQSVDFDTSQPTEATNGVGSASISKLGAHIKELGH